MIYIFSEGGTGSVYFSNRVRVGVRPDTVWGFEPDIKIFAPMRAAKGFMSRSGEPLDPDETIEENLVRMLLAREGQNQDTMLCGRCSQKYKFLTDNGISAICFVRHPLHAMISFFKNRHPEHVKQFGGYNTAKTVLWYGRLWNTMTDDFIASGNPIYLFEEMPECVVEEDLRSKLSGWTKGIRHNNDIKKELELLLQEIVHTNFFTLYKTWEV